MSIPNLAVSCYHCGLAVPIGTDFSIVINQAPRQLCCLGCQAIAQAISDNGLADYYRYREALPASPQNIIPEVLHDLQIFDQTDIQVNFVSSVSKVENEAHLILEGVTCAACMWLNEQHLMRQRGVTSVQMNYTTRRLRIRWDTQGTRLSELLAAVTRIGYRAYPYDTQRSGDLAQQERRTALWRLFVAGFGMMQVMMYALPAYIAQAGTLPIDIERLMQWASLMLTLPVVFYSAAPFFRSAWRDLRGLRDVGLLNSGVLSMDVPIALGIGSAFVASVWATLSASGISSGAVYFDSIAMFVFLLLCGRYLEMIARQRASRSIEEVGYALPAFAERFKNFPDNETERIAVTALRSGDIVRVCSGQSIPADGIIMQGDSAVDESLLTGESTLLEKHPGDTAIGGSINGVNPLIIRIEKVGEATRLSSILRLMDRAMAEKPLIVAAVDRLSTYFVVTIIIIAGITAGVWSVIDPSRALWIFVSVLVVSCPCALSLATPVALTVATAEFARLGMLVSRGHAIETLAKVTHFIFDKTGSLTQGNYRLIECIPIEQGGMSRSEVLALAAALELGSAHPIGHALLREVASTQHGALPVVDGRVTVTVRVTGQGIEGTLNGRTVRIGRPDFVRTLHNIDIPPEIEKTLSNGESWVALGDKKEAGGGAWLAFFSFGDTLRSDTITTVKALRQANLKLAILSGDTPESVKKTAKILGLAASEEAQGSMTPEQKHAFVCRLQAEGAVIAMLGDGLNDLPVLAQSQVSIAIGQATELTRQRADIVLLGQNLFPLVSSVKLARRTLFIIKQNLCWAIFYNAIAIPFAMLGWMTPWMAGIGMSGSSLLVVLNALRLKK